MISPENLAEMLRDADACWPWTRHQIEILRSHVKALVAEVERLRGLNAQLAFCLKDARNCIQAGGEWANEVEDAVSAILAKCEPKDTP